MAAGTFFDTLKAARVYVDQLPGGYTAGSGQVVDGDRFAIAPVLASEAAIKERLEYLRGELRAERISTGELVELQSLVPHIAADDVELLEAAGVKE